MPRPSLRGQLLVSQRDADGTVRAFTGVQIPGVLDDLYADAVADADARRDVREGQADVPAVGADRPDGDAAHLGGRRRRRPRASRGDVGRGIRNLDRQGREVAEGRRVPVGGRGLRAHHGSDRDEPGHRPVLGRADDRTPSARSRSTSTTRHWRPKRWEKTKAPVIDRPVDRAIYELHVRDFSISDESVPEARARHVPGVHARQRGHGAAATARRRRHQHRAPAADLRHRHDRGGPHAAGGARLRPRFDAGRQHRAAGVHRAGRRRRRLQLGLRPVPLLGSRGLVRGRPGGRRARRRVPLDGRGAARHRTAGRARRGVQPHSRSRARPTSRCSTRSCPATTSA